MNKKSNNQDAYQDFLKKWLSNNNSATPKNEAKISTFNPNNFADRINDISNRLAQDKEINATASEQLQKDDINALKARNENSTKLFEEFIKSYQDKTALNLVLKKVFFWFFIILTTIVIALIPVTLIVLTACGLFTDVNLITVFSSSALTALTTIIVIPKIIAQYLFSVEEDSVISNLVNKIQEMDDSTRRLHSEENTKNRK